MKVEVVPIDSVYSDPANTRLHPDRNLEAIKASLKRFSQQKPIVVDENGIVRAGNGTLDAARQLGWKEIAVVRTDLKGAEAVGYSIADNRSQDLGTFDHDALGAQIAALIDDPLADISLADVGFSEAELKALIDGVELPAEVGGGAATTEPAAEPEVDPGPLPALPENAQIIQGDVLEVLKTLSAESVHCVVTSPPYHGLRDYGTGTWQGGDSACDHIIRYLEDVGKKSTLQNGLVKPDNQAFKAQEQQYRSKCGKCGALRIDRQIGLEESFEDWLAKMVEIFREVKRVLHRSGTIWVNMGDSYFSPTKGSGGKSGMQLGNQGSFFNAGCRFSAGLCKPKDLVGQPWRLAFALRDDGWYLRSAIVWNKPNPMPESVTDRPTKSYEMMFLLAKSEIYFYNADAVRERTGKEASWKEYQSADGHAAPSGSLEAGVNSGFGSKQDDLTHPSGRNLRDVWQIPTESFKGAHFATYPRKLVMPCVKAGTSAKGCCPKCLAPWERIVEAYGGTIGKGWNDHSKDAEQGQRIELKAANDGSYRRIQKGWQPTCACSAADPIPCTILDIFNGSGTTGLVALNLGRKYIGIELNHKYIELAKRRIFDGYEPELEAEEESEFHVELMPCENPASSDPS